MRRVTEDTVEQFASFSNDVGLRLGLDVERGIPRSLGSAGGTMIDSFGHEVVIQTFGIAMSSIIYFAKFMPSAGLCRVAFQPIRHPLILPTTSSRVLCSRFLKHLKTRGIVICRQVRWAIPAN